MLKSNISINTFIDFKCYNIDKPKVILHKYINNFSNIKKYGFIS